MQSGLLPVSQEAIVCGEASYFDFKGAVSDSDESDRVARSLGPRNKVRLSPAPARQENYPYQVVFTQLRSRLILRMLFTRVAFLIFRFWCCETMEYWPVASLQKRLSFSPTTSCRLARHRCSWLEHILRRISPNKSRKKNSRQRRIC